jgi:hypothetical protein
MIAKYPVDVGDDEGILDAINYLLSGPAGLGQNFAGFSSYIPAYLTGNFRTPFAQTTPAALYVPAIALSNAQQLDDRTIKYTFASAQPAPPFSLGNGLTITGITPADYNSNQLNLNQIGVVECTTTYVIVRNRDVITTPLGTYVSGGDVELSTTGNFYNSTDCDVRVTVTGGSDRVFVSGQLENLISYEVFTAPADFTYSVRIERYRGTPNNDPTNPDFIFEEDATIVEKVYSFTVNTVGTGTFPLQETVFSTLVDQPTNLNVATDPGYIGPWPAFYRYILETKFRNPTIGDMQVTESEMSLRSIAAQVVKQ